MEKNWERFADVLGDGPVYIIVSFKHWDAEFVKVFLEMHSDIIILIFSKIFGSQSKLINISSMNEDVNIFSLIFY